MSSSSYFPPSSSSSSSSRSRSSASFGFARFSGPVPAFRVPSVNSTNAATSAPEPSVIFSSAAEGKIQSKIAELHSHYRVPSSAPGTKAYRPKSASAAKQPASPASASPYFTFSRPLSARSHRSSAPSFDSSSLFTGAPAARPAFAPSHRSSAAPIVERVERRFERWKNFWLKMQAERSARENTSENSENANQNANSIPQRPQTARPTSASRARSRPVTAGKRSANQYNFQSSQPPSKPPMRPNSARVASSPRNQQRKQKEKSEWEIEQELRAELAANQRRNGTANRNRVSPDEADNLSESLGHSDSDSSLDYSGLSDTELDAEGEAETNSSVPSSAASSASSSSARHSAHSSTGSIYGSEQDTKPNTEKPANGSQRSAAPSSRPSTANPHSARKGKDKGSVPLSYLDSIRMEMERKWRLMGEQEKKERIDREQPFNNANYQQAAQFFNFRPSSAQSARGRDAATGKKHSQDYHPKIDPSLFRTVDGKFSASGFFTQANFQPSNGASRPASASAASRPAHQNQPQANTSNAQPSQNSQTSSIPRHSADSSPPAPPPSHSSVPSQLSSLSIRELKSRLASLGVSSVDCVEKHELIEKLLAATKEKEQASLHKAKEERVEREQELAKERIVKEIQAWCEGRSFIEMLNCLSDGSAHANANPLPLWPRPPFETVHKLYKKVLLRIHPDKNVGESFEKHFRATELFKIVSSRFHQYKLMEESNNHHGSSF